MRHLRPTLVALTLAIAAAVGAPAPGAQAAMPANTRDLAQAFASCLGRYSASIEHGWLTGVSETRVRARHDQFSELLAAVQADARAEGMRASDLLSFRINAKMAQAQLLEDAQFGGDERRARIAASRARQQMRACDLLLIG